MTHWAVAASLHAAQRGKQRVGRVALHLEDGQDTAIGHALDVAGKARRVLVCDWMPMVGRLDRFSPGTVRHVLHMARV